MGEFGTDLSEELGALANGEAPPSAVSAAEAVRQGRSQLRRRRSAMVGAIAAIVVTAGALASLRPVGGAGPVISVAVAPSLSPSPGVSGSSAGPRPQPSSTEGWQNRPLTSDARFGWLPDRVTTVRYDMTPWGPQTQAIGQLGRNDPFLTMKVYPAGVTPALEDFPQGRKAIRVDAPPINGREAYWVSTTDADYAAHLSLLRWKTADGRWAELNSSYLEGADLQQVPLRVAADVTVGTQSVPMPFRVSGVPAGAELGGGEVDMSVHGGTSWSAVSALVLSPGKSISISVRPDDPSTAQGLPGGIAPSPPRTCKSDQGVQVCVWTMQDPGSVFAPFGGPEGMLQKITLLGSDPAKWITDVIS